MFIYILYPFILFFVPGTFKLYEKPPDVETLTEEESEGKAEKGKERNYKRKRSKDDSISEDSDDPDLFSAFTPKQKKPAKNPSLCESLNYSSFTFTFTLNHLADTFIQSDVQMRRTIEAVRPSREQQYTSAMTSLS